MKIRNLECVGCGVVFQTTSGVAKYCSAACGNAHRRSLKKGGRICPECGKPIEIWGPYVCSGACAAKAFEKKHPKCARESCQNRIGRDDK